MTMHMAGQASLRERNSYKYHTQNFLLSSFTGYPSLWLFLLLHDCDCFLQRTLLPHKCFLHFNWSVRSFCKLSWQILKAVSDSSIEFLKLHFWFLLWPFSPFYPSIHKDLKIYKNNRNLRLHMLNVPVWCFLVSETEE